MVALFASTHCRGPRYERKSAYSNNASGRITTMPQGSREGEWELMMTMRNHVHSFFDGVHRGGRYRIFTGLERHAGRPPKRTSVKRRRLRIGFIAAIATAALSFGLEPLGKQARSGVVCRADHCKSPCSACTSRRLIRTVPFLPARGTAIETRSRIF
jgi:hypothetical protein